MPIDYTPKKPKADRVRFSHKYSTTRISGASVTPVSEGYNPRVTTRHPSKVTDGGDTNARNGLKYTGNEMIGISIIHKSCLQPIFNSESAKDAANMRR